MVCIKSLLRIYHDSGIQRHDFVEEGVNFFKDPYDPKSTNVLVTWEDLTKTLLEE